jgi:hypothetical protein
MEFRLLRVDGIYKEPKLWQAEMLSWFCAIQWKEIRGRTIEFVDLVSEILHEIRIFDHLVACRGRDHCSN